MKRGLFAIVFLFSISIVLADSEFIDTSTIPDLELTTGENDDVLDLDDYYNGTDLFYKFKDAGLGLEGVTITFDESLVSIVATSAGEYAVIFIADNDTDDKESNVVDLTVTGTNITVVNATVTLDYFPVGSFVLMDIGEKQTFAVSGGNVVAEWFLNGLKLPETSGNFEFDAAIPGENQIEVRVGEETNTWTVNVEELVEPEPEPEIIAPPEPATQCGNGKKEKGENCQNCPSDVSCAKGSSCLNSICIKDEGVGGLVLWIGGLGALVLGLVGGIVFAKKKGYLDNLSLEFLTNIFSKFKKKEKVEEKIEETPTEEKTQVEEKKPVEDLSALKTYIFDNLKKGFKKEDLVKQSLAQGWKQEQIDKVLDVRAELKPLYNYINDNLKKGFKKEDLAKQALGQGWKQKDVDEVVSKL